MCGATTDGDSSQRDKTFPTSSRLASLARPAANEACRSSPTRPPHTPLKRINGRSRPTYHRHHDPASGGGRNATAALPPTPRIRGHRAPLSTRLPTSGRSDQDPRAAPSAAAPVGRRRAASLVFATGRTAPPARRRTQRPHSNTGTAANGDPQQCRSQTLCVTARGRIVVAVACGPTLPDARAFVRPADPAPGHRPDGGRGHERDNPAMAAPHRAASGSSSASGGGSAGTGMEGAPPPTAGP